MIRIVVLTNDSAAGRLVLQALQQRHITPDAILIPVGITLADCFRATQKGERWRELPRALARWVWRRIRFLREQRPVYRQYSPRIVATGSINSNRLLRDLKRVAPDMIVLGTSGILGQHIIATARFGVLNAHPGLLPWVRGLGVVGHALEFGIPVGATCHYVNRLIDAGAIIERRLLPVEGDTTLQELEVRNTSLAVETLADVVAGVVESGEPPIAVEQNVRYPLLRWYEAKKRKRLDVLARSRRPQELFERWKPLCVNQETWTLPREPFEPPEPPYITTIAL
jgi:folate-dependent phosphoribosylglycinamide formyltransferase PurN